MLFPTVRINYKEVFKTWEPPLRKRILETDYMNKLIGATQKNYKESVIRPAKADIFRAFKLTPYDEVRVVILGQDPYPNKRATGLAFGNEEEDAQFGMSPSLKKIHDCIEKTVYDGLKLDFDPTLVSWGKQGVLLLNSSLTVRDGVPNSHSHRWRPFIRETFKALNEDKTGIIFLLLGGVAKTFGHYINRTRHHVLTDYHPAFACRQGRDWNCPHFNKINEIIESQNGKEFCIRW